MRKQKIYAFYKGEVNICDGTIKEIADYTGKRVRSLQWMTYPTYNNRLTDTDNKARLVEITEELESEC